MTSDLHCHTKMSDGSTGIEDVISIAKRSGIGCVSITDHDTMAGCVRAQRLGERYGVKVIHGVELSAFDYKNNKKVHILAYLTKKPDRLEGLCKRVSDARKKAAAAMIKNVVRFFPVTPEQILRCASGSTNIFKQHIMHAIMDAGYAVSIYGDQYDKLFSPEKGSCLVEPEYPDVSEMIACIRDAGGVAILAHPAIYCNDLLVPDLIEMGLAGIEVWHPRHTTEDTARYTAMCKENQLLMTGGSDFHGMYSKTPVQIGSYFTPGTNLAELVSYL